MSAHGNPNIITDGLVLCLDAADKKSLLAPPTINLANNSNGTINWTIANIGAGGATQSTVNANDYHYRFVLDKGSASYIAFRFAFDHTNLTDGETYIMSYKYKIISGSGTFQVTDFGDVGVTRVTEDIGDGWYYETAYGSRSSYSETYDFFDVRASDNMTIDIKEIQVEHTSASSPLATPFVSYQRQWKDRAGSNNGTFVNMNDQSDFSSESRGSLIFDGTDDYLGCGVIGISSSKVTFAAWIKFSGSSSEHIIDASGNACHLAILSGNKPYFYNGSTYHTGADAITNGVWYYLTGVQSDTNDMYINGVLSSSINSNVNISVSTVNIGRWQSGGRYFNGDIASAQIYNRALTADEVLQNYNATKSRFEL